MGLTGMVGRKVGGRGQQRRDMYREEKAAAKGRKIRHDLKVSTPSGQVECSRKRSLVAQPSSRYRRQRISNNSGPKRARIESFPRRSGEKEEVCDFLFQSVLDSTGGEISFTNSFDLPKSRVHRT